MDERYKRHYMLPEIGASGQDKISNAKVLIVGAGGLGSPAALYLAAAGVGTIGIVDADCVDISNLQRQIIHSTADVGRAKVDSASNKMRDLNPQVDVRTYCLRLDNGNARAIIGDYDFVIDATDNHEAKFLINDVCVELAKPFSHGSVLMWEGQTFTYLPGSACYRCIYGDVPPEGVVPKASEAGIFGVIPGVIGCIQAAEAIKYITSVGTLLTNQILCFNAKTMQFITLKTQPNRHCACNNIVGSR